MKNEAIIKCLKKHIEVNPISFHTPGHKNGSFIPRGIPLEISKAWKYDITEIAGLDNLHNPQGCIKEAQEEAAKLFKAKSSHFLVNGSSLGIHSAIMALSHDSYIFVPRNVHKSVYNAIILANAIPIYLPVTLDKKTGVALGVELEVFKQYIRDYPQCKVVILANPNYQGISYKIKEIIYLAKLSGLKVIIDEAHGSHFSFHPALPSSGLELRADIVIQSWHKTLPVLTQASVLHEGLDFDGPDMGLFINMFQTTSPSYLLLAALDTCRAFLAEEGYQVCKESYQKIAKFKKQVKKLKSFSINFEQEQFQDFLKLNLSSEFFSGVELDEILRREYALFAELSEENYILFILSLKAEDSDLSKLLDALTQIDKRAKEKDLKVRDNPKNIYNIIPHQAMSPRQAFFGKKKSVPLDSAQDRICGEYILKYPPGIPLMVPGEIINDEIVKILKNDRAFKDKEEIIIIDDWLGEKS